MTKVNVFEVNEIYVCLSFSSFAAVASVEGSTFTIPKVDRKHMGPYLCIASNGKKLFHDIKQLHIENQLKIK